MADYPNDPERHDPERPEVPNTSLSEPSSHFETERFFWNHRPVVWWIMGGLGLLIVIGMVGVALVVRDTDQTERPGDAPQAAARPTEGSSAVAGQGTGKSITVSISNGQFEPKSASVPRGGSVQFAVVGGTCHLEVDGKELAVLFEGQDNNYQAKDPGDFDMKCGSETQGDGFRLTVP